MEWRIIDRDMDVASRLAKSTNAISFGKCDLHEFCMLIERSDKLINYICFLI